MILAEGMVGSSRDRMSSDGVEIHKLARGAAETSEILSEISGEVALDKPDGPVLSNVSPKKKETNHKEITMQDIYNNPEGYEDDDEDSDWEPMQASEPLQVNLPITTWCCRNCTMISNNTRNCCNMCKEHRESGILKHGFFAPPSLQESDFSSDEIEGTETFKAFGVHGSSSGFITGIGFDERMLLHSEVELKSHPHPERPDRLRAIAASLSAAGMFPGRCHLIPAREITQEELLTVHSLEHVETVEFTSSMVSSYFTYDTYANEHSALAARLAAGLCADLASSVYSGKINNGFALVRPPGHHAGVRDAMGFCLHNNAAVAALAAQAAGAKRVLILDWDVHHGNGTQEIFEQNKSVLYISLHRHESGKFYPGTGAANEVGSMGGEGYCINIPWSRGGVGDNDYIFAFQHIVLPIAAEFAPDITIVSAGFDAARGDPLGWCDVTPAGYAKMTQMLSTLSGGKLLVILEGGYNLRSISSSATAVVKVLLGESFVCEAENATPSRSGLKTVLEVLSIQMKFWPTLESCFAKLQSDWGQYLVESKNEVPLVSRKRKEPERSTSGDSAHSRSGQRGSRRSSNDLVPTPNVEREPGSAAPVLVMARGHKIGSAAIAATAVPALATEAGPGSRPPTEVLPPPPGGPSTSAMPPSVLGGDSSDPEGAPDAQRVRWAPDWSIHRDQEVRLDAAAAWDFFFNGLPRPDWQSMSSFPLSALLKQHPLSGYRVTPAGYAKMTQMLSTLSGGKLLVILEGGYNLRSISSSATAMVKALLEACPGAKETCPGAKGVVLISGMMSTTCAVQLGDVLSLSHVRSSELINLNVN